MKKKMIGIIGVLSVMVVIGFFMMNRNKAIEVTVATVEKGNISEYVEELATLMMENQESVYAPTAGKVTAVQVKLGDQVEKGDVLVRIDAQQLSEQKMLLEAQKAAIMAQYHEAIKPVNEKEIEKLELLLTAQERNVAEAQRKLENSKKLYEAGAISNEEYQSAVLLLDTEMNSLEKIKLDLELIKEPISPNIAPRYEAQLRQFDLQIQELARQAKDFVVYAPMRGTVMMKEVDVGSYLQPGAHIMELGDKGQLYLESDILVGEIGKIEIETPVEITNKDLGIEGIKGSVRKIHPQAFSKISDLGIEQKRVKIEIQVEDSIENLRPGYDLDIKVITDSKENVLLIPENAVFQKDRKTYVFVNENNTAVLREIQKGMESQRLVEVISGLQEGEEIIISPDEKLKEGISIQPL
ncbi:efflux RND transporter periplasmic adaptor subunit [Clostridium formicaceticum]|uniref:Efflux system component YknX n=1 Tax=Clostridium formicaceticum TaxID=1497 RepID=A0AAC9RND2_9CLOT|nr:efflux RND transporter periplasmic adaptor subunit [Clostridium formicaceticum]AOY78136.1 efflux transporter periplasmic adaptor subunit [Clostridium formicaceticum]ARE88787.1 Putative efflux system component YknX [Clostridium formicaceticum]